MYWHKYHKTIKLNLSNKKLVQLDYLRKRPYGKLRTYI